MVGRWRQRRLRARKSERPASPAPRPPFPSPRPDDPPPPAVPAGGGPPPLTERQLRILFHDTLSTGVAEQPTYDNFINLNVTVDNILATEAPLASFDALHLAEPDVLRPLVDLFGAAALVDAFVATADDAVAIAGTPAFDALGVSVEILLQLCAGHPEAAAAVLLAEAERGVAGVAAQTLLDTGVRAAALKRAGVGVPHLATLTGAHARLADTLGFRL